MNKNIKNLLTFSTILSCILISYIFCDNFLSSLNKRSPSIGHIKKEIAETLVSILHQSSRIIELLARSQISAYGAITQIANNDKDSKLVKANKNELENTLVSLKKIKEENDKYINEVIEFLKLANTNFIKKTENRERC